MKVYTKGGDKGQTSLFSGERISKTDDRVDAYGTIDELNSMIGVIIAHLPEKMDAQAAELSDIQHTLFQSGSWIATMPDSENIKYLAEIEDGRTHELEKSIDEMTDTLSELKDFILPGGSQPSAWTHVARTICRRAERALLRVDFSDSESKSSGQIKKVKVFLNRLSDYLFVLSRFINHSSGISDRKWEKHSFKDQ